MQGRTYSSPARDADAARTRAAIVDAARSLFETEGYAATTKAAIAKRAGVSVQSVHLAGSKAALLIAAFERAFAGDEGRHSLAERPQIADIMARADTAGAIVSWLDYVASANARTSALVRAMRVAAETDAVAAAAVDDLENRRRTDLNLAARWLIGRGLIAAPNESIATDELNYLVGPETFEFFVTRSGWDAASYRAWLDAMVGALTRRLG